MVSIKKFSKYLVGIIGIILLLMIVVWLLLQTCYIQNKLLPIITQNVSSALGTEVTVQEIDVDFWKTIVLKEVRIKDANNNDLISIGELKGNIGLFSFFNKKIFVNDLILSDLDVNIYEENDSMNYQHIIDKLSGNPGNIDTSNVSQPWEFDMDHIKLENVSLAYQDEAMSISSKLENFETYLDLLDLDQMRFDISTISTSKARVMVDILKESPENNDPSLFPSLPIDLNIGKLNIDNSFVSYHKTYLQEKEGTFDPNYITISDLNLALSDFKAGKYYTGNINSLSFDESSGFALESLQGGVNFSSNNITLDNIKGETRKSNINVEGEVNYSSWEDFLNQPSNSNFTLKVDKSQIATDDVLTFLENKDFPEINLDEVKTLTLNGLFTSNNGSLKTNDLYLNFSNKIIVDGDISIDDLNNLQTSRAKLNFSQIKSSYKDLKSIFPSIELPPEIADLKDINITGKAEGTLSNLEINNISISTESGIEIAGSGTLKDINTKQPYIDYTFDRLLLDPQKVISDTTMLPEMFYRLGKIAFTGNYKGNYHQFSVNGNLKTQLGEMDLDMLTDFNQEYSNGKYRGTIGLSDFDLQTLLQDDRFGIASLSAKVFGEGLSKEQLDVDVDALVSKFDFQDYQYNDVAVNGNITDNAFMGSLDIKDENITMRFNGEANLDSIQPRFDFMADIDTLNLHHLGFLDTLVGFSGNISSNLKGSDINNMIGNVKIEDLNITTQNGNLNAAEDVTFDATLEDNNEKKYVLSSEFVDATILGNLDPTNISNIVLEYLKSYIPIDVNYSDLQDIDLPYDLADPHHFEIDMKTRNVNPLLDILFEKKVVVKEMGLNALFSNYDSKLEVRGKIDSLIYGNFLIPSGKYRFSGEEDQIKGNIDIQNLAQSGDILIPITKIDLNLNEQVAHIQLNASDEDKRPRIQIGGNLHRTDEYIFSFDDTLNINNQVWQFSEYNQVIFGKEFFLQDLRLFKDQQSITVYTDKVEDNTAVEILLDNLIISDFTKIINKENDYIEGNVNGNIVVNQVFVNPFITSDLNIINVNVGDDEIGELSIVAQQNAEKNTVEAEMLLSGDNNDAKAVGVYNINSEKITGKINIAEMNVALLDAFLFEFTRDSKGSLSGNLNIGGKLLTPELDGAFLLENVETTPVFTNSRYKIKEEKIRVTSTKIDLDRIELEDVNGDIAMLTGYISHNRLQDMNLNFNIDTDKFQFLNTTANENEIFYGDLGVAANVNITGPVDDIYIEGNAEVLDNSYLSISPLSVEETVMQDDFIIFRDPNKVKKNTNIEDEYLQEDPLPMTVDIKINVDDNSTFEMIINPITGDKLVAKGSSNMTFKMLPDGEMEMYGNYLVSEGSYDFSYGLVSKKFIIDEGSTVSFNGDPLDGVLDVSAIYKTSTTVYELLSQQSKLSDREAEDAKRNTDINVILNLDGSILTPEITLDIKAPNSDASFADVLNEKLEELRTNPDELNNQVFGLLLLNSFILSSSSNATLASTGSNIAISSLSNLISSQLNKLADGLIKGVQVNLDFNSYQSQYLNDGSGGLVTELGVGVSKNLFNDRLTITAGTNLNLESSSNTSEFNAIAGDFILQYKLTREGNYAVKVYRKSTYDRIVDENNSKNGISFYAKKEFGEVKQNKIKTEKVKD